MPALYYLLSLMSGIALTLQAGLNGQLRARVGSPILSSFISFLVGTLGLGMLLVFMALSDFNTLPTSTSIFKTTRWWMFTGGLLGAFYIFITIFASPQIGFANMFSLVICGQIVLSVLFDHLGLMGNAIHVITPPRILGLVLLILGVVIIQKS